MVTSMTESQPLAQSAEYFAAPGLSNSGLSDLAISPLRYWHRNLSPDRPRDEPTPEMIFGSALHTAVLEPSKFEERYVCALDGTDFPGLLVTIEDLRGWLRDHGVKPKGTLKGDLIAQVEFYAPADKNVPPHIWDVMIANHAAANAGKIQFKKEDWFRICDTANALRAEPKIVQILNHPQGRAEVPVFATDPETGVLLKARMDWISPTHTLDLKTFSQKRGKSIDKTVADAIWYERYWIQAYWYSLLRSLQGAAGGRRGAQNAPEFVMAFVESDPPHDVRLRALRPRICGEVCEWWERARFQCRDLIRLYADCVERFGDKPWREEHEIDPLEDLEMPGLSYGN